MTSDLIFYYHLLIHNLRNPFKSIKAPNKIVRYYGTFL